LDIRLRVKSRTALHAVKGGDREHLALRSVSRMAEVNAQKKEEV